MDGPSLFERTLLRLHGRPGVSAPVVVTGVDHVDAVKMASLNSGVDLDLVLVEPEGRNTAPACLAAALACDEDDVLVIVPSDHLIQDIDTYADHVVDAAEHARRGEIVTFGIRPSGPEIGFGYIEMGETTGSAYRVVRFKEKPDLEEAQQLVADGRHVWNSGMFIVRADVLVAEAASLRPDILASVESAMRSPDDGVARLGAEFKKAEKVSLDHAIMEHTGKAVVIPMAVGWDDVGSFEALWSVSEKDNRGNTVSGDTVLVDVSDSFIHSTSRRVAVAGISGVVVVETDDAVLVVPTENSQLVKSLVEKQSDTG
jgi:mannose-1-phosphate guanylyltransferase/mannose-1-phosphate guanylyltransferase/mannose-6-phosphate isomerase